jgi:hypothetical protein
MSETMNLLEAKALEGVARVYRAIWSFLNFRLPRFALCLLLSLERQQLCCLADAQRSAAYRSTIGSCTYIQTNSIYTIRTSSS